MIFFQLVIQVDPYAARASCSVHTDDFSEGGGRRGLASPWISEMYVFQEILGLTLQFTIFTFIFLI